MSNAKISGMTDAGSVADNDLVEMTQAATTSTKSWKMSYMFTYLQTKPWVFTQQTIINQNITAASSITGAPNSTIFRTIGADGTFFRHTLEAFGTNIIGSITFVRSNGTAASPSTLLSNDRIGIFEFLGHNGSGITSSGAAILARATENWGATNNGTSINFNVVANTTSSGFNAAKIDQDGSIKPGTDASYPLGSSSLRFAGVWSSGPVVCGATTVSGLPAASSWPNGRMIVTDANSPTLGAIVSGGGSVRVGVNSDGTNWRVG